MSWTGPRPKKWHRLIQAAWAVKRPVDAILSLYRGDELLSTAQIADRLRISRRLVDRVIHENTTSTERKVHGGKCTAVRLKGNKNGIDRKLTPEGLARMKDRWGSKNPNWKGRAAKPNSVHPRAVRKFPIKDKKVQSLSESSTGSTSQR